MIKSRNKALYTTSYRIPVLVLCPDFTNEELSILQAGLQSLHQEYSSEESLGIQSFLDEAKTSFIIEHPYEFAEQSLKR